MKAAPTQKSLVGSVATLLVVSVACSDRIVVVGDEISLSSAGAPGSDAAAGSAGASGDEGRRVAPFILGADLSWVQEDEDNGAVFVDAGVEQDIFQILEAHGFNYVRLRLFHDPTSPCRSSFDGGETCGYQTERERAKPYCDLENTLLMAQRVQAAGMGLLLNFHLSDTWADPQNQHKPWAWSELSFPELVTALEAYTRETLLAFVEAGVLPGMVQLGNEITPGLLFPEGATTTDNWDRFATLTKAAIAGVRSVDPSIRILLHIEKPDSFTTSDWWLTNVLEQDIEFDVLGQSCFTDWHGPPEGWTLTFDQLAAKYPDLDFVITQYSQEKRAANDIMWELPEGRGLGTFIWEPTRWRERLFDRDGNRFTSNDWIHLYDEMARDYGLRP